VSKASDELKKRVALLREITGVSRGGRKKPKDTPIVKDAVTKKG